MMNDSEPLLRLRVALREGQDSGQLPYAIEFRRRFHVMVSEIGVPVLRDLVNLFCLEGVTAHLLMGMDEATPFIGLEVEAPQTTLWVYPSSTDHEVMTSINGGGYPHFCSIRHLSYRVLTKAHLESILVEQLRLVLCPEQPLL